MRRHASSIAILSLALLAGCWTGPRHHNIHMTGTVYHSDLEGGFWAIRGDDGEVYVPVGDTLPKELQVEGLGVRFAGWIRKDMMSTTMAGTMVQIGEIGRNP
jgi:hypothetical protein